MLAGVSGSGKSTLHARGLRPRAALLRRRRWRDASRSAGATRASTGPRASPTWRRWCSRTRSRRLVMNGVRAELELPLESRGHGGAGAARAVEETALALGIDGLLERPVRTLSGGELQRVALAAALVAGPRLLLLDEPTSQLDPVAGEELLSQLRRLNEEWGTTVLLAEHRLERCLAAADRVIALDRGRGRLRRLARRLRRVGRPASPGAGAARRAHVLAGRDPAPAGDGEGGAQPAPARRGPRRRSEAGSAARRAPHRRRRRPALSAERRVGRVGRRAGAGAVALRGLSLELSRGETVALLGRNGAGKSTLLRVAAGVVAPDRGDGRADGRGGAAGADTVRLLAARARRGRAARRRRRPRRWRSWGWSTPRSRPARPLGRGAPAAGARHRAGGARHRRRATRRPWSRSTSPRAGWTRRASASSPSASRRSRPRGAAVLVATHDVEFAARAARRCVLLGAGRVVADGSTREVLVGRPLLHHRGGAGARARSGGVVLPEEGASMLAQRSRVTGTRRGARMSWQGGSALIVSLVAVAGICWYERRRPTREAGRPGRRAGRARGRGAGAVRRRAERAGHDRRRAAVGLRPRARARVHGRRARRAGLEPLPRPGAVDALADGRVGRGRARRRAARIGLRGRAARPLAAGRSCAAGGACLRRVDGPVHPHQLRGGDVGGRLHRDRHAVAALQHRARDRQLRACAAFGPAFVRVLERFSRRLDVRWAPARHRAQAPRRGDDHDRCSR